MPRKQVIFSDGTTLAAQDSNGVVHKLQLFVEQNGIVRALPIQGSDLPDQVEEDKVIDLFVEARKLD